MDIKFKDIKYIRPDIKQTEKKFSELAEKFMSAGNASEQFEILKEINTLRADYETMTNIAHIRYTVNTEDEFYSAEHEYFDNTGPLYMRLVKKLYQLLTESEFRAGLEELCGKQLFASAEVSLKTFSEDIIDDLKKENHLVTKYVKLIASAKINFEGEERNIAGLDPFLESENRELRKSAFEAKFDFFREHENELDFIYDELVKTRTLIAKKLGYENFVQLGYDRMRRTGYTHREIEGFRNTVKDVIVPLTEILSEIKRHRLGLDHLYYYDAGFNFKNGNPVPKGPPEWIVEKAKIMYEELSHETEEFFDFMIDYGLMDLYNRKGKSAGGYCTYLKKYKSPFIFANMNGTDHDIKVLTHEAGHAFQKYQSRGFEIPEYIAPTSEAAEIHSMAMEFITWPWMDLFFEEDTDKFLFSHLNRSLFFIPYGVSVDEFQHFVYSNPDATPADRKKKWREIEVKYKPYLDYEDNEFLNRGGYWFMQSHIFKMPFYYIDYCLAEICALQFWRKSNHDRDIAWKDYLNLCKAGGSMPFLELVKYANLGSPFDKKTVESIVNYAEEWIESVNKEYDIA